MSKRYTKESFREAMASQHGDGNDYSETVYVASNQNITVRCREHGYFTMFANAHQQGDGCPRCEAALREQEKQKEFQVKVSKFSEIIDYSASVFKGVKEPVHAYCKVHNKEYTTNGRGALLGRGCKDCKHDKIGKKHAYTQDEYMRGISSRHGDTYDHTEVVYKGATNNVSVICKEHGKFNILAGEHLAGRGCPKCAYKNAGMRARLGDAGFAAKATLRKPGMYNYTKVKYVNSHEPVEIICNTCKTSFMQTPTAHLSRSGCPNCAKTGFNGEDPAYIYVLHYGDLTKVGITNVSPQSRLLAMNRGSGHDFSILASFFNTDGHKIKAVETKTLQWLRTEFKNPSRQLKGYTECFVGADPQAIIKFVEMSLTN